MLSQRIGRGRLAGHLLPLSCLRPYPAAADRESWESLPGPLRESTINGGEEALAAEWPALPASLFLEYARSGDRRSYEALNSRRRSMLADLAAAYCMEPHKRFIDPVADAAWSICEESWWGYPAHMHLQEAGVGLPDTAEPVVDLFAAETGALLSWCSYLLGAALDEVSPLIRMRIEREVRRRILEPCLDRDDFWWMGFGERKLVNNWNPWINSNWLTCVLLVEGDRERRLDHVEKIMRSLDVFIDGCPRDGGCDEGPNYWGRAAASLFDCLELLRSATGGAVDVYAEPLIADMGRYIYRMHVCERWFVNFADASAVCLPDPVLVHSYGRRTGDADMQAFGAYLAGPAGPADGKPGGSIGRRLRAIFSMEDVLKTGARPPLPRDVWLPESQIMIARSAEGATKGFFLAAKGGHNGESHNHNDVGQFVVFEGGRPVLVDAGVETYRRKTFSRERYDIWTMQSGYHNLPTVGGFAQAAGREFCAGDISYAADDDSACLELDMAPAYPAEAGIRSLRRKLELCRRGSVVLSDGWELDAAPGSLFLSLMTPCSVEPGGNGHIRLAKRPLPEKRYSGCCTIRFDPGALQVEVEEIPVEDARLAGVWGASLRRIMLRAVSPCAAGGYRIHVGK